jgi:hypothetical protein
VHGVQVVTVLEEDACQAAFDAAPVCFVLTNTRSLAEPAAAGRATRTADGLIAVAGRRGARLQLLSRSDSTPRGHVMAAGPSFVRALAGLAPRPLLRGREIRPRPGHAGHDLIVVGSYVSQTSSPRSARAAGRACFITDDPGHGRNRTGGEVAVRAGQALGQAEARGMGLARRVWSAQAIFRSYPMADPDTPRHTGIRDGDQTIAAAEVVTCQGAARTARVWLHAAPGHVTPGGRASLVDAVMDLPEVQTSARLQATVPLGDTELPGRLRQRTHGAVTRPAGCTALVDADMPPHGRPGAGPGRGGGTFAC